MATIDQINITIITDQKNNTIKIRCALTLRLTKPVNKIIIP